MGGTGQPAPRWRPVGMPTERLVDARLQAHHAAQVIAAAGHTLAPARPDDSHTAMTWDPARDLLAGTPLPGPRPLRLALRPADLTLELLGPDDAPRATLPLGRRTIDEAFAWAARELAGESEAVALERPAYGMPRHPVEGGRAFDADDAASLAELSHWFANAAGLLGALAAHDASATGVRCWPHHFDIATLIALDPPGDGGEGEEARSVSVGMTPGDDSYREPYLYVTPWPYPRDRSAGGDVGEGTWHRTGWFGAVLTGSRLVAASTDGMQREVARSFVERAVPECRALAGA